MVVFRNILESNMLTLTFPELITSIVPFRLIYEQDLVVNLQHEKDRITEVCDREQDQINKLKEVLELVERFENFHTTLHPVFIYKK